MKILTIFSLLVATVFLTSCESSETKKIGEAQACLNQVRDTDVDAAKVCLTYIDGVNSEEAEAVRCAIKFVAGGVTTQRIVDAVTQIDDNADQEQAFMAMLVFNGRPNNDGTTALENAEDAAGSCNASGVEGLMFMANFAVVGTALMKQFKGVDTAFWNSPDPDVSEFSSGGSFDSTIQTCANNGCDNSEVGSAVLTLGDSYCNDGKADEPICKKVAASIAAGGSDPEAVGAAFYGEVDTTP